MKPATRMVHFDPAPSDPFRPMATPIYQTATFEQEHADSFGEYDYSRSGNPTRRVLEDQVAALEGGCRSFAFSSGMTAIATVTRLLKAGDEIVADWDLYGGASRLFDRVVRRAGVTVRLFDGTDIDAVREAMRPSTKMLYVESPTNPLLRVLDLRALAAVARDRGVLFCVDSSAMSPYLQQPLALGADIVIHSGTKLLCGHSDVTAGVVVVKDEALAKDIYFLQNAEGTALGPMDCFLLLRGLKTLKLRVDAQQANALAITRHLQQNFSHLQVAYPGLEDNPVQASQASGGGVLLTFRAGSPAAAKQIAEGLALFKIAVSFGSVNSTISIPYAMSHASVPAEQRAQRGIPEDLLRISCGIEDADDLIADLTTQIARL